MKGSDILTFLKSNTLAKVLAVLGVLIVILFIFEAGVIVGFHKAEFAEHWEENYGRNFGPPGSYGMPDTSLPNPHGASGKIVSVSLPTFVIAGTNENEKTVRVSDDTVIRDGNNTVDTGDLAVGKYATVIGSPNDSAEVEATFIRIMPPPPGAATSTNNQ